MNEIGNDTGRPLSDDFNVDFDPLDDLAFDEDIDDDSTLSEGPFGMPSPDAAPAFQGKLESFADKDTAEERISALFDQMPTLQKILYGILRLCEAPSRAEDIDAAIEDLKRHHHCVYSPSTFCSLLERAGAIEKVDETGQSLEDFEQEPQMIEVDGTTYWVVAPPPCVFWKLTDAGLAQLEGHKPFEAIQACFDDEPLYADIFKTILELCGQKGGTTVKAIGDAVEDEPAAQEPRRYAMYFIDKLERAGALDWNGAWTTTEEGKRFLSQIDDASGQN